uniref:Uncharacterized protein n=1 Tax=Rhizophora mucronata TaxID=61149 RepID=A0A2P2PEG4_RHIMU
MSYSIWSSLFFIVLLYLHFQTKRTFLGLYRCMSVSTPHAYGGGVTVCSETFCFFKSVLLEN